MPNAEDCKQGVFVRVLIIDAGPQPSEHGPPSELCSVLSS